MESPHYHPIYEAARTFVRETGARDHAPWSLDMYSGAFTWSLPKVPRDASNTWAEHEENGRRALWETYAPPDWQEGRCPHGFQLEKTHTDGLPWPQGLTAQTMAWVVESLPLMATVEALVTEAASRYRKLARAHGGHTEDRQPSTLRVLWRFPDRLPKGAYLTPPVTWAQSVGVAAAGPQHIHPAKSLEGVPERIRRIEAKKGVAKGTLKNPYTPLVDLQKQHRIGILGLHKYQPYKQETPLVVVCPSQRICDSFHEARYYKT